MKELFYNRKLIKVIYIFINELFQKLSLAIVEGKKIKKIEMLMLMLL